MNFVKKIFFFLLFFKLNFSLIKSDVSNIFKSIYMIIMGILCNLWIFFSFCGFVYERRGGIEKKLMYRERMIVGRYRENFEILVRVMISMIVCFRCDLL